jgi:hypothetical protein
MQGFIPIVHSPPLDVAESEEEKGEEDTHKHLMSTISHTLYLPSLTRSIGTVPAFHISQLKLQV